MNKRLRRGIYCCLIVLLLFGSMRLYYRLTDDFRLANITYELPFDTPWQVPALNPNEYQHLERLLNQRFFYIGKGAQCYAFVSEDDQYVLKFFKFKHLKPNLFIEYLPSISPFKKYKQSSIERKRRKLIGVFNGYDLAFRENRQISQLLYLHLLPTKHLQLKAKVVDKMGLERNICLDEVVFLIQRRGETLRTRLCGLLNQKRVQEAKEAIAQIFEMYILEYKKGIYDHDHGILHNTGFIGNQPFHLDVGKLNKDERMQQVEFYKKDLELVIWRLHIWIKNSYPQYYPEFSNFFIQQYQQWTSEALDIQAIDPERIKKRNQLIGL
jgi:hypothetical protein